MAPVGRRRRRPLPPRRPEPRADPFLLGVRQAKAGVPKTGSQAWVEAGNAPADWYLYSCGYDGVPKPAGAPEPEPDELELGVGVPRRGYRPDS